MIVRVGIVMKPNMKLVLLLLLGLSVACGLRRAEAQSNFYFANWGPAWMGWAAWKAPVRDWNGNWLAGADWRVELYGGSAQDSLQPAINLLYGTREIVSLYLPGYFRSGSGSLSVLDVSPHGWAWLQVNVWDVRLGATFEAAVARGWGGYGQSALFYAQGGDPGPPNPTTPAPLIGLQSFSVLPVVPEPAVWLLLAGGLAGLLVRFQGRRSDPGVGYRSPSGAMGSLQRRARSE
jgi:hypothetical protein